MQARYYSNGQGRFTSLDSFAGSTLNPQTLNLYAYVQNNPLNFNDPTGHYAEGVSSNPSWFDSGNVKKWCMCQDPLKTSVRPPAPDGYVWTKGGELAKQGSGAILEETVSVTAKVAKRGLFKRILGRALGFFGGFGAGIIAEEIINPSQTVGGGDADLGPASIPWAYDVQSTFMDNQFSPHKLERDATYYRYSDPGYTVSKNGPGFLSEDLYSSSTQARAMLALSPAVTLNKASTVVAVVVPAGTIVARGRAAPQGPGYPGGGSQVVIGNPRESGIRYGTPRSLP